MQEAALFDHLDRMDDPVPRDAALNMAIDEVLLAGLTPAGPPILRVYRWNEPTISIGYFERTRTAFETFPTRRIVRRWTGGGIVEHGDDLTYSLLVPRQWIPHGWRGGEAYHRIHGALAGALKSAGLDRVTLAGAEAIDRVALAEEPSRECFDSPVTYDVLVAGRKIAGAAQRRTRHGLLHQGSIRGPGGNGSSAARFGPGTPLHDAVCSRLPAALGRRFEPRALTASELEQASHLAATRYGTSVWLERF